MTDRFPQPRAESRVRRLLRKLRRRAHSRESLWRSHLALFGSVNAFLLFLNVVTPPTQPWFLYVLGAMSIPLAFHGILRRRRDRLQQTLESWTDTPERVFAPLRKMHRTTSTFLLGAGVGGTVSGYLLLINALSGGSFWAPIPIVSIAFPVVLFGLLLRNRRQKLQRQLEIAQREEPSLPVRRPGELPVGDHQAVRDAHSIRERIRSLVQSGSGGHETLTAHVDDIVAEIERLARLEGTFDEALSILPLPELERERDEMKSQMASAPPRMKAQYEESLRQIDAQLESLRELLQKREMLSLRLRTGVNSLRQVSLDLASLRSDETLSQLTEQITHTADELSRYLGDLQASYDELSRDLSAER